MDANAPLADDTDAHAPVDSDEEKDAVMAALARWRPQPLAQHTHISLRRKHQRLRVKEALAQALAGNRGQNLFAVRPPEAQVPAAATTTSGGGQVAAGAAGTANGTTGSVALDGTNVTASPVGIGGGGGAQGGNEGGGAEKGQHPVQQGFAANMNGAAGGSGGAVGLRSRKSSVSGAGQAT